MRDEGPPDVRLWAACRPELLHSRVQLGPPVLQELRALDVGSMVVCRVRSPWVSATRQPATQTNAYPHADICSTSWSAHLQWELAHLPHGSQELGVLVQQVAPHHHAVGPGVEVILPWRRLLVLLHPVACNLHQYCSMLWSQQAMVQAPAISRGSKGAQPLRCSSWGYCASHVSLLHALLVLYKDTAPSGTCCRVGLVCKMRGALVGVA